MKTIVFGGEGFLGARIARALGARPSRANICSEPELVGVLDYYKPDVVINAAGKTGRPNVDWCETHIQETIESNTIGPLTLANLCNSFGVHLVHLASGCVFYGEAPRLSGAWLEGDAANPKSVYSRSKYAADLALTCFPNVAIVRLRMPIDGAPGPRNLITKLAGYQQVIDVVNSVTVVDDLIEVVRQLVEKRTTGIFHAVNPDPVSHRQILDLYRELVDPKHKVEFITEKELFVRGLAVAPRSNCVLDSERLEAANIFMPPTLKSLRHAMEQYAKAVCR